MVKHRTDPSVAVTALRRAAPYIRMYCGKVFLIKMSGGLFSEPALMRGVFEQISILLQVGIKVVVVHGGGKQLTDMQASLGIKAEMVAGRRVTDAKSINVTSMVLNGLINTQILGLCRELGINAVGVSGVDAGLIRATKRPPVKVDGTTVDYGFVGDILGVDPTMLQQLLDDGIMPVISPISADEHGTLLNINADTVASAISAALKAEKLIICAEPAGIMESIDDPHSLVSYTDLDGLARLRERGCLKDGVLPKAKAIEDALRGGVGRVHIASYKSPDTILAEVFTNEGTGTMIVGNIKALSKAEQTA